MNEPVVLVWLLIQVEDALLVLRRKADRPPFAGRWVLPGDVMRVDESALETIQRVGGEELDLSIMDFEFVETLELRDGKVDYAVNVFRVTNYEGRPRYRESGPYADAQWLLAGETPDLLARGLEALLAKGVEA
jgi:ADP-ribose pyrophosphatase YjhB (NUDIX family)